MVTTHRLFLPHSSRRIQFRVEADSRLWTLAQIKFIRDLRDHRWCRRISDPVRPDDFDFSCLGPEFFVIEKGDRVPKKNGPQNFVWYDVSGRLHVTRISVTGKVILEIVA